MRVQVKICGLNDAASVAAVISGGASFAGFVFYPPSPRCVHAEQAAALTALLPPQVAAVGLFVDAGDEEILRVSRIAGLRMIQLHGRETPQRVAAVKRLTGLPVIRAAGIAAAEDVVAAHAYASAADYLLLDAKPKPGGSPGGNATAFDWGLLKNAAFDRPWFLAGGLDADNLAAAVAATGARLLDVSSGVEDAPGRKNPLKIRRFLDMARQIETSC